MNTDGFIHSVVMVLILKVKKLAQPKCRLIHKSTPAPALPFLPFTIIYPYIPVKIELLNTGDDNKNT
jgi:hypothetical protein